MRTVELAEGITATVADDVSPATINALRALACEARHREKNGYMSGDPLEIKDGIKYENRAVACAACRAVTPNVPWPNITTLTPRRPRCGKCNSPMTYPIAIAPADSL